MHFLADGGLVAHTDPTSTAAQKFLAEGWKYAMREQAGFVGTRGGILDAEVLCLGRTTWGTNYDHVSLVVAPSARYTGAWEDLGSIVRLPKEWWSKGKEKKTVLA